MTHFTPWLSIKQAIPRKLRREQLTTIRQLDWTQERLKRAT